MVDMDNGSKFNAKLDFPCLLCPLHDQKLLQPWGHNTIEWIQHGKNYTTASFPTASPSQRIMYTIQSFQFMSGMWNNTYNTTRNDNFDIILNGALLPCK